MRKVNHSEKMPLLILIISTNHANYLVDLKPAKANKFSRTILYNYEKYMILTKAATFSF